MRVHAEMSARWPMCQDVTGVGIHRHLYYPIGPLVRVRCSATAESDIDAARRHVMRQNIEVVYQMFVSDRAATSSGLCAMSCWMR